MRRHGARLRERGLRLVLADDFLVEEDRELFDDVLELPPPSRVAEALRVLEAYCARHEVAGVLAETEAGLLPGALLIRRLGLRGPSPEAAHLCTNKYRSRLALEEAGVGVPRFALASGAADVRAFARKNGLPLVLKPIASTLGQGVTLVRREEGIDSAVERVRSAMAASPHLERLQDFARVARVELACDPGRQFLVESFARGSPVETDGLVIDGEPFTFGVTDQVLTPQPYFYIEGYLLPAERPREELEGIVRASDGALRAVGLDRSGFSIEMRADGLDVRVIDLNGRLGEDDGFGQMFRAATGRQPMLHAIELAAGLEVGPDAAHGPRCALAYRSSFVEGVVARVPCPEEVAAVESSGVEVGISAWVGSRMHAPPHPETFPHMAFALATHPSSSRAAYERAREAVLRLPFEVRPDGSEAP
jgi:biotin carboxylase